MSNNNYDSTKDSFNSAKEAAKETFEEAREAASHAADDFKKEYDSFTSNSNNKRILAGILGIFFGYLGIHKFVLGYNKEGIILLIAGILTCGGAGIIGLIEGIIYLTKSEEEFYQTYQVNKKPWF
ncbi:TM2 domain-containing protein [Nonlabens mediterrranea]|uniref:TM2 domain-containing protein n=1 Tax=Nonlabens mediterrranea TaxID=1419947 RepID=A0ABS0A283_9FLAO|nr:TM2 domain-containing protein [Nonlabens mediterrranea]